MILYDNCDGPHQKLHTDGLIFVFPIYKCPEKKPPKKQNKTKTKTFHLVYENYFSLHFNSLLKFHTVFNLLYSI